MHLFQIVTWLSDFKIRGFDFRSTTMAPLRVGTKIVTVAPLHSGGEFTAEVGSGYEGRVEILDVNDALIAFEIKSKTIRLWIPAVDFDKVTVQDEEATLDDLNEKVEAAGGC